MIRTSLLLTVVLSIASVADAQTASPDESGADLAKKLSNPVADLISMPFQFNYNGGFPEGDGEQFYLHIQPVIPISISPKWIVISRTILPIYSQDISDVEGRQVGFGATTQSFFFSPKKPTNFGLIWGVGPAFTIPTSTDGIAPNQWGAGITGVVLKQSGPWSVGGLANHIWSLTGNSRYGDASATFLQPFVAYTTPKATTFTLQAEATYDWEDHQWSVPIHALVAQVVKIGHRPVQFQLGTHYWAEAPEGGPEGWGARFMVTLLFPK